jgi:hypothetical protein
MYTQTASDTQKLDTLILWLLVPRLRRAILETAEAAVCQIEGFHPDMAYSASVKEAADEITSIICDYFAGLSYRGATNLFDTITEEDLKHWLDVHYNSTQEMEVVKVTD